MIIHFFDVIMTDPRDVYICSTVVAVEYSTSFDRLIGKYIYVLIGKQTIYEMIRRLAMQSVKPNAQPQ